MFFSDSLLRERSGLDVLVAVIVLNVYLVALLLNADARQSSATTVGKNLVAMVVDAITVWEIC